MTSSNLSVFFYIFNVDKYGWRCLGLFNFILLCDYIRPCLLEGRDLIKFRFKFDYSKYNRFFFFTESSEKYAKKSDLLKKGN